MLRRSSTKDPTVFIFCNLTASLPAEAFSISPPSLSFGQYQGIDSPRQEFSEERFFFFPFFTNDRYPAQSKRGLEGEWGGPEDLEREREAEKDGESGKHGDAHTHFATGILATEFSLSTGILSRRTNLSSISRWEFSLSRDGMFRREERFVLLSPSLSLFSPSLPLSSLDE